MASVQERLQLKRMPLENWSISEQLYLASAVACSGDQNWMSVSRQLKAVCGNNRPSDWFSQKSCAAQYDMLLGNVEPTKRKKRNEKDTGQTVVETPIEQLVRKLTQERIVELNKLIQEEREEFQKIRIELNGLHSNVYDENQLREMIQQIENEEKHREKEKQKYDQWLKEREERKREMDKAFNKHLHQSSSPNFHSPALAQHLNQKIKIEDMEVDDPNAKQGTSPLLTSLLKSPSAAPNPSPSMLHNMPNQTRVAAPTITNLLTGSVANLSSSLSAAQQAVTKTITTTSGASMTPSYSAQIHNQPLTGPPSNDHLVGSITQSPSQAAPTLSMLLENKQKENMLKMPPLTRIDSQGSMVSMDQHAGADTTKTEPTDADFNNAESPIKDEDQQLMDVFNELIPEDIGELADIILDDLINEEQVAAVSRAAENLEGQVNLDLKNFQSQPAHTTEAPEIKEEPINVSESTCDSTVAVTKIEDTFDELKEQKDSIALVEMVDEKKVSIDLKDEDSDLSNDTPLSELIKQEESAKQLRSQAQTPKDISSTIEQPEEIQEIEPKIDQPPEIDGEENLTLDEEQKIENTTDLLENEAPEQDDFVESPQQEQQNEFEIKSPEPEEKPSKIEIEMPIDSFESDSNEEKSMENIKRKIEALPELKDSNSSENSQDENLRTDDTVLIEDKLDSEIADQAPEKPDDNAVDQTIEKVDTEETDQFDESVNDVEPNTEKDENIESISIKDESNELPVTKEDTVEQREPDETICDSETVEKSESAENEKVENMDTECQIECVESPKEETKEEQPADSTAADNVVEILDDDIIDKDELMQEPEPANTTTNTNTTTPTTTTKEEIKAEADILQPEADDLIEIKSDDEKSEAPEEKAEKIEEPVSNVKDETENITADIKEKSTTPAPAPAPAPASAPTPAPAPAERKASTDDELFEDAKETLEVEVKPPKPITPVITCDTDDDSVIEVVKEEKVGVKRDYSRRKKDQSHNEKRSEETTQNEEAGGGSISSRLRLKDRDRSESPFIEEEMGEPSAKSKRRYSSTPVIDSLPNSPASSDDREYRSWKKSIQLLYSSLAGHRCASIFAKPITDDQAPNYKTVILHPMDLQSLKRNIDSGQIRNTQDFQLYVMRMCYNAIFYNINDDVTCSRAKEMLNDALQQIAEFSVTWKKENEKPSSVSSSSSSNVTKSVRGRKSNRLMN